MVTFAVELTRSTSGFVPYGEKKAPAKPLSFFQKIFTFPETIWKSLKGRICVSPLEKECRKAAAEPTRNNCPNLFLKGLTSSEFPYMRGSLKMLWRAMSLEQKHTALTYIAVQDNEEADTPLFSKAMEFITLEEMKAILKSNFPKAEEVIESLDKLSNHLEKAAKESKSTPPEKSFLLNFIKKIINSFKITISLLQKGKEPDSYFEGAYLLDIFYKLLFIPATIFLFLIQFFTWPVSLTILAISTLALYITSKFIDEPVLLPAFCVDLLKLAREGKIRPVPGRADQVHILANAILFNKSAHVLLHGESRVGKTTLVETLACMMSGTPGEENDFLKQYPELANKRLILVKTADLKPIPGQDFRISNYQKLLDVVGENDIVFFDDLQAILNDNTIADKFNHDLPQDSFGATTSEGVKAIMQNTSLSRRFGNWIHMEDMNEESIKRILILKVETEAPEIEFSEEALNLLLKRKKKDKEPQPWNTLKVLGWVIANARKDKAKEHYQTIDNCKQKLQELEDKLHGCCVDGPWLVANGKSRIKEFEEADQKLNMARRVQQLRELELRHYIRLKSYWKETRDRMVKLAKKIHTAPDKKHPDIQDMTTQFLYTQFFSQPLLKEDLEKKKSVKIPIDKSKMEELLEKMELEWYQVVPNNLRSEVCAGSP